MKKLLYSVLALALLLVVLYGGNIMYQRYSLEDGRTHVSARVEQGRIFFNTQEGRRYFNWIEVVCKRRDSFNAVIELETNFFEGEIEGAPLAKSITLPAQSAKFSYRDGIWVAQFYVIMFHDGHIGIAERFPRTENMEEFLESLIPFEAPPNPIAWQPFVSSAQIGENAIQTIGIAQEIPVPRARVSVQSISD